MSLQTPIAIRTLQRKLYRKTKQEPDFRFYLLYDKIYHEDVLRHAYELAKANKGAPGVDGQTFEVIESEGLEKWLEGIRKDLRDKTYKPQPVRRVLIPKPGGGERPLGIPTIRDRTVQTAAKLVLEPSPVVRGGGLLFSAIFLCEVKNHAREDHIRGVSVTPVKAPVEAVWLVR